jgi:hypothetical protein
LTPCGWREIACEIACEIGVWVWVFGTDPAFKIVDFLRSPLKHSLRSLTKDQSSQYLVFFTMPSPKDVYIAVIGILTACFWLKEC